MRLPHLAGCAIIGISPLLWLPALPNMLSVWCLIGAAYLCGLKRRMSVKATGQALVAVANLLLLYCGNTVG